MFPYKRTDHPRHQEGLATLAGGGAGAVTHWESENFRPTDAKKAMLIGLRKLGRWEVKELLAKMGTGV